MTTIQLRQDIESALESLERGPLIDAATRLFATLGYRSERRIDLEDTSGPAFAAAFDREGRLEQRAWLGLWRSVEMIFQLSGEELRHAGQMLMNFGGEHFDQ